MSKFPSVDIFAAMLEPSFFEEFATAINKARDRCFCGEESDDDDAYADASIGNQLPYDLQDIGARILCDLSNDLSTVWQQQAERLVQQYAPLPPVTAEDLMSHLIPQLAGVPLDPDRPTENGDRLLRAALMMDRLFCYPEGGIDDFGVAITWCDPDWVEERVLTEFKIKAPDFLHQEWDVIFERDVIDEELVELHKQISEKMRSSFPTPEELKRGFEVLGIDLSDFFDHGPKTKKPKEIKKPKDDELALQDFPSSRWDEVYDTTFWKSDSGAAIRILPVPDVDINYETGQRECVVKVMLDGDFTPSATKVAVERLRPAVNVMLRLALIAAEVGQEPRLWRLHTPGVREFFSTGIDLLLDKKMHEKDELTQRLYNALYLLQTEEGVTNHRLGLSLCFGAIESLLTIKGGRTLDELKSYTVALLQPDPTARKRAKKTVECLYDVRSQVAHGRWVTPLPEDASLREIVRTLAVGVLIGVIEARGNRNRVGKPLTRHNLHTELIVCEREDQAMVGVEDLSAFLPSNVPKTKAPKS